MERSTQECISDFSQMQDEVGQRSNLEAIRGGDFSLGDRDVGHLADRMAHAECLARTIEGEIIPRLMLAHQHQHRFETAGNGAAVDEADVVEFAHLALGTESADALNFVRAVRERGVALERIYLDLLAPAAQRLGQLWEADLCDFAQVTIGLWRLQQVLFELSPSFQRELDEQRAAGRSIMLAQLPGSQHNLGVMIVADFFRRAGWSVSVEMGVTDDDLLDAVRRETFDVVGLSVSKSCQLTGLDGLIASLRSSSRRPGVGVMVGGPIISHDPALATRLGADATALDAARAVETAERLVAARHAAA